MMKALSIKKIVIAMAITLVVAVLPAAGINKVLAETAKTEETTEKKPEVKKASDKKKETKKVSNEKKEKAEEVNAEEQPASTVQTQVSKQAQASQQASSSSTTYNSEAVHPVSEPIQGSIQVEQIPETPSGVQETTTTTSSGIQVETPAPAPSQPNGTEGVHQQPTVVVDEVVELN